MQRFRLVRVQPCGPPGDLTFLSSLASDGSPVFTANRSSALLMSWTDFVSAASTVWLSIGPVDIYPDPVYVLPTGGVL